MFPHRGSVRHHRLCHVPEAFTLVFPRDGVQSMRGVLPANVSLDDREGLRSRTLVLCGSSQSARSPEIREAFQIENHVEPLPPGQSSLPLDAQRERYPAVQVIDEREH